ncbi:MULTISPECIES: hypothetical protein [Hymenobacter]|uniref:Uncharacterized protein n=1 Tax=Hymenobacter jejuensis TaxID=2502781 RepID=A0A5B8A5L1_9BACT|nr:MULTISPECIES: hypothetical protein [Hymenobacter]MBC6989952.1 hypothetical protein [Hymenobacter sp. BT491]QDA61986.1 hypothetical protein FHG12_18605 [Hymenobacter jejuensis]
MVPSPIAHAMRLWQDMLGREHETPRSFLWQNVEDMEPDEGGAIEWKNQQTKTRIYFKGDKVICVLGDYSTWRRQWMAFAKWHKVPLKQMGLN